MTKFPALHNLSSEPGIIDLVTEPGQAAAAAESTPQPGGAHFTHYGLPASDGASPSNGEAVQISPADMRKKLLELTGFNVDDYESRFKRFTTNAQVKIGGTEFYDQLTFLQSDLEKTLLLGKIRGVDAWANGNVGFKVVTKSWDSFIDKLYRVNYEENNGGGKPPEIRTIEERAARLPEDEACNREWVTPDRGHLFLDDLVRTKFVVPFADGVVSASDRVKAEATKLGLRTYRRYHAKDSGYHAHHVYVLLPVPSVDGTGTETEIAFEIKILTKLQDNLGELTHLLYEYKRTGQLATMKKRALAWQFESTDFTASYIGHSAHYIEASLVRLKAELLQIGGD